MVETCVRKALRNVYHKLRQKQPPIFHLCALSWAPFSDETEIAIFLLIFSLLWKGNQTEKNKHLSVVDVYYS